MSNSKRKRHTPEQIIRALAEGEYMLVDGNTSAKFYQKLRIAESTWMRWKQQYGGMKSQANAAHLGTNPLLFSSFSFHNKNIQDLGLLDGEVNENSAFYAGSAC